VETPDQPPEKEAPAPPRKQRFKLSKLEILIGSLIVLGFLYLVYLVLAGEGGDGRKLEPRLKALESKVAVQTESVAKELQGLKPGLQQIETRLKALEDHQKQADAQMKQMQARPAPTPPRPVAEEKKPAQAKPPVPVAKAAPEEKKPAPPAFAREKIVHKIKKGENIYSIARKYRVYVQDVLTWNKLPANPTLKVGDSLVIYKR
jgi:LysM repeat protein